MANTQTTVERPYSAAHEWSPTKDNGEHKSSSEIERDIDRTRHDMDATMDALGNRVHPRSLLDQLFEMFQDNTNRDQLSHSAQEFGARTMDTLRDNPMPFMLVAAGIGWMVWNAQHRAYHVMKQNQMDMREEGKDSGPSLTEKASDAFQSVKDKASSAAENLKSKGAENREKYSQKSEEYREKMEHGREELHNRYEQAKESSASAVRDNPLAFGFMALAAGILVGMAFPSSREEKEIMGEPARKLRSEGEMKAQNAKAQVEDVARETIDAGKKEAKKQELTPEQLSRKAETAAHRPQSPAETSRQENVTPESMGAKAGRVLETAANKAQEKTNQKT